MDNMEFRTMCERIKGIVKGIQHHRVCAVALIGFLEGSAKLDPERTYSTDQVVRLIRLIWPEIE